MLQLRYAPGKQAWIRIRSFKVPSRRRLDFRVNVVRTAAAWYDDLIGDTRMKTLNRGYCLTRRAVTISS